MKIAYATIAGSTHRTLYYNSQDAVEIVQTPNYTIGIVADGCGSGSNSEVGAQLGVKFLAKYIQECITNEREWKNEMASKMHTYTEKLIHLHTKDSKRFTKNYLLYTLIGFVLEYDRITLFSCGDGVFVINDNIKIINQNNRPKYLNNGFLGKDGGSFEFTELKYTKQKIIVATDGFEDLVQAINNKEISEYESVNELLEDEQNFDNPIQLPKLLAKYADKGILKDDCTLIMLK